METSHRMKHTGIRVTLVMITLLQGQRINNTTCETI